MNHNFVEKMIRYILILMILFSSTGLKAQGGNLIDADGKKQGTWSKFYEDSPQLFYRGQFKNDLPEGTFTYYYRSGKVKGVMEYLPGGKKVKSVTYYPNGKVMAKGNYIVQKKDSIWNYYTDAGILNSIEHWDMGAKHGLEEVFFDDGSIAEETNHKDGLRNGDWKQYYESGRLRLQGSFVRDELNGTIIYFYQNGSKEITGKFLDGLREGTWMYFNKDGSVRYQSVYRGGELVKERRENGTFVEYGPDNILLSSVTYKAGKREGVFQEYHDDASFEMEPAVDKITGDTYMKQVKIGNELKREGVYKNDLLHGEVKHYNEKGIITKKEKYINGELE